MSNLGHRWAGKAFGTNTGNLFAELTSSNGSVTGSLRFMDEVFGLVIYDLTGTFDGSKLSLSGAVKQVAPGATAGALTVEGQLTAQGEIRGAWSSTLGTAGTFVLFPHDAPTSQAAQGNAGLLPEQLHTVTRTIGAARLYAEDVRELINFIARDFRQPQVVVTYRLRGAEVSRYAPDFLNDVNQLGRLHYLKLFVKEPEAYGIERIAMVELNAAGSNEVRVQAVQESWAIGKAEALCAHLQRYSKPLATSFRKFGLNINTAILLVVLVLLPDLPLGRRVVFFLVAALCIFGIVQLHARFIPNVVIFLSAQEPNVVQRAWPQVASWLLALTSAVAASIAYGFLKGELSPPDWWARLMGVLN
jgi:hypothetical protein